jgi:uncharacterized membrane protein
VEDIEAMEDQPLSTSDETTSDDRLWAALGYPIPIIALVLLFMEDKKDIPFLRFHAVQSIALNIAVWVLIIILVAITFGAAGICAPLLWFATLWPAYDAYKGNYTEIPVITKFLKGQGWA